jgi:hypothetical protein
MHMNGATVPTTPQEAFQVKEAALLEIAQRKIRTGGFQSGKAVITTADL